MRYTRKEFLHAFRWTLHPKYSADLLDVIGIVARHVDGQFPDRDAATLGMDTKAFPLFWRDVL